MRTKQVKNRVSIFRKLLKEKTYGGATEENKTDRKEFHGFQEISSVWSTDSSAIQR